MTIKTKGYAALKEKEALIPFTFTRRDPLEDDVVIEILYCGICHSDVHKINNDWGGNTYPVVPGHEIIGKVSNVGSKVKKFQKGDIVGVGCIVDSCKTCDPCKQDLEQFCNKVELTTNQYGGYSDTIVVKEGFVLKVPKELETSKVAPILCAGITTWSPLKHWNVKKGSKVAVIGFGGLGHMAIKLAKALGAEVTLFTRSLNKTDDAIKIGADNVVLSTDNKQMSDIKNKFDLIIDTVPYIHDLNSYMQTLNINGTLVVVGHLGEVKAFNTVPLVMGRKSVSGSLIGGIKETQELLDFCAQHNIVPDVEIVNIQDVNKIYERMLKSDVKHRYVIDMASLKSD